MSRQGLNPKCRRHGGDGDHGSRLAGQCAGTAIAEVEVPRALRRLGFAAGEGQAALDGLYVIDLDAAIRARAATLLPLTVRSIDALHLATALELGAGVDIVTYDEVLAAAARAHGFTVRQPGR